MKKIFLILLLSPVGLFAQTKGIDFVTNLNWEQVKAKAKTENKFIMVDCYTTWCGWCRWLDKNIFPNDTIGQIANSKFIAVRIQFDSSDADNAQIKNWYTAAHDLKEKCNVTAYPTQLFFNADGEIVSKIIGVEQKNPIQHFANVLRNAQDSSKQYYTLAKKYKEGSRELEIIKALVKAATAAGEDEVAMQVSDDYVASQKNLFTKDNIDFLTQVTRTSKDTGFVMMFRHPKKADSAAGKPVATELVRAIIFNELGNRIVFRDMGSSRAFHKLPLPDWKELLREYKKHYPSKATELLAYSKLIFFEEEESWAQYCNTLSSYMKKYSNTIDNKLTNKYARNVFLHSNDKILLAEALKWSEKTIDENNATYLNTYANILYKTGKKNEALQWQQKAIAVACGIDKTKFSQTMTNMKKGKKTW